MDYYRLYKIVHSNKIFWILFILIFIVNLIIHFTVIREQQNQTRERQKKYTDLRNHWKQGPDRCDSTQVYENGKTAVKTFMDSLPRMTNLSDKARELSYILKKKDINTGRIIFTPDRKKELPLWKYSTSISIFGTYQGMKNILADIQGSPSLFCIEHLSFSKGSGQDQVNMKLKVATYCR